MRVPRLTIRRMMFVVAAVAMAMFFGSMIHRARVYREKSRYHLTWQESDLRIAEECRRAAEIYRVHPDVIVMDSAMPTPAHRAALSQQLAADMVREAESRGARALYHQSMASKYSHAMWRRWNKPRETVSKNN
ncbi:hypothetical protein [Singulisphaera sp. PoT]|uniref:hypothetical protein n=1 Tax=Singulisphaera sp. PoT TaxID=3411797 RepID=UPI003BF495C2